MPYQLFLYLALACLLFWTVASKPRFIAARPIYSLAFIYRLGCASFMTYLIIHRYHMGDLPDYFFGAIAMKNHLLGFDSSAAFQWPGLKNTGLPMYFFGGIFLILPPSIYGITLLSAAIVHIAFMYLYELFKPYLHYNNLYFLILFFMPTYIFQSSYLGKETLVLPLLVMLLYQVRDHPYNLLRFAAFWIFIYFIRFYQGFFLMIPYGCQFIWHYRRQYWFFLLLLPAAGFFTYLVLIEKLLNMHIHSINDFSHFINHIFHGGSHMLAPYPFPFNWLQSFRPFPWEAHNAFAYFASLQQLALFVTFLTLISINGAAIVRRITHSAFLFYCAFYVLISMTIFSFDKNMGDLSRHMVYYMLILFPLLCLDQPKAPDNQDDYLTFTTTLRQ